MSSPGKSAVTEERMSSKMPKENQSTVDEKNLIQQLPAFPTLARRSKDGQQSRPSISPTSNAGGPENLAIGSRSRAQVDQRFPAFTWADLEEMSKAGEANPKWPPRTEKLVCLPQMHASKSPSSSAKSSLLQRIDTPKPVTPSKHQCVQPCHKACKHQGLSCGSPKPELLEKGDAGSQEVQKHSKPPVSLVGVGQSFRRRKCDATEEYPQTVVFEHHNLDSIPAYERPVKKVSDGAACYPSQPPQNQSLCPAVGNYQDEDEDDEGFESQATETECPSDASTYGSSTDTEGANESETETCSGSPSSHFSFDIVSFSDVPGFREHAGGADSGKRKAAIQGNRAIGGGGNGDGGAQKRAKNDLSMSRSGPGSNGDEDDGDDGDYDDDGPGERLLFACPYYKRDPGDHFKCERQTFASVSRVKGHVLRAHLKPLQCARCGTFRAGDEGQIRKHLRTTNCQQPARFIPVDERIIQKGKDLKKGSRKAVTWKQVYVVLFDCAESEVPSEYPEPAVRAAPQRPAAVPAAAQSPVNNGPVQDTVPVSSKNTLEHLVQAKLAAMIEEPMRRFVSDLANTIAAQLPLEDWNAAMEREPVISRHPQQAIPAPHVAHPATNAQEQSVPAGYATSAFGGPLFMNSGSPFLQPEPSRYPPPHRTMQSPSRTGSMGSNNTFQLNNYGIIGQPMVPTEHHEPDPLTMFTNTGDYNGSIFED